MCDNKERILKCPCDDCIVLAICKNKTIQKLFQECSLMKDYIIDSESSTHTSKTTIIRIDPLYKFCNVMGISIRKNGNDLLIRHRWDDGYVYPV